MKKNKTEIFNRISELRKVIEEHNRRYYQLNTPVISDFEYDLLTNELENLEKQYPEFLSPDSPTRKVGNDLSPESNSSIQEFVKVQHRYPMYSLSNTYDKDELSSFIQKIIISEGRELNFSAELKFDGTAISLTYKNGMLQRALTRGDGVTGEDVTINVLKISSIPYRLKGSNIPDLFEVRGEIYMPYEVFDRLNAEREDSGENLFANPRNAAAGSLKLLDSEEAGSRGLECVLYQYLSETSISDSHTETLSILKSWGLPVSAHSRLCKNEEEILNFLNFWDIERKKLPFATDGAVIKVDDFNIQAELGFTSKSPRWATAYKFRAEQSLTRILSVDFQVGRTGAITPVANLDPVLLSGTTVKRASLHNAEQMKLLDIRYGDYVIIEKGGEIIPKIVSVDLSKRPTTLPEPVAFPDICPDCGTSLIKAEDEARHYCPNRENCPTQIKSAFIHFCGRKAMNILAGDATINQLYEKNLIRKLPDLYNLSKEDLLLLEGWKDRSAERFLKSLEESKKAPFQRVLFSLGIRYVGETTAKKLAEHFHSVENMINASEEELSNVDEVGEILAKSIKEYFRNESNLKIIEDFKNKGLNFALEKQGIFKISGKLEGMTIVISGNFSVSRESLKELIENHSGKNGSSVTSNTDYLLAGEKAGPAKLDAAKKHGTKIIDENEFYKILEAK